MPTASLVRRFAIAASLAASFAFASLSPAEASAAKRQTNSSSLALSYQYTSLSPGDPSWCLSEDDFHLRTWTGSLNGSYSATDYLCNPSADYYGGMWWDAGGDGVYASASVVGSLSGFAITSPTGVVHQGVLVGTSTSKGVTTYDYEACYVPPFSLSSGVGGAAVPGGTWTVTLSGDLAKASFSMNTQMGYVDWQQEYCPPSEQNLIQ